MRQRRSGLRCGPPGQHLEDASEKPERRVVTIAHQREVELTIEFIARATSPVPVSPLVPIAGQHIHRVVLAIADRTMELAESRRNAVGQNGL